MKKGLRAAEYTCVGAKQAGTVAKKVHDFEITVPVYEVGFDHASEVPALKLAKSQELRIEMYFDDRQDVCDVLNANGILALRVPRLEVRQTDNEAEIR